MKVVFWLCLAAILYTYIGYPVIVWILSRLRPRPCHSAPILPSVSIVLAVHNGAALLQRKIRHLLDLDYPNIREIILVSDGSTDGTAALLANVHHPLVKTIVLPEHGGKAVAVNAGVQAASGEILLFVDIRPEIGSGAIQMLVRNFADPEVGCVAGELALRQQGSDAATGAVGGLYWQYEQWLRKCESAIDSPTGVYGGFYAIRRALAEPQPAGIILDDMFQPLSIVRKGFRSVLDPDAKVFDTWPPKAGTEFHRKVRTLAGNFQLFKVAPWTLTTENRILFQMVSHKVLRLIVPYLMVLLLVAGLTQSGPYFAFSIVQIIGLGLALLGLRFRIPLLNAVCAPASALLVLNTAAVVGLYKFLFTRGPLWKIWTVPAVKHDTSLSLPMCPDEFAPDAPATMSAPPAPEPKASPVEANVL